MKKTILLGVILALPSLVFAQTQSTTTTSYLQTSTVIGSKIKDSRGQDVGVIKDFVLDRNTGCLAYVVLSAGTGGAVTTSTKTVTAPWAVFTASSDPRVYITRVEREKIYGAPVWEATHIEEYSRTEYINSVYGYYGIAAPRFDAQMSVGVTNTTTTSASAAPTAAASVAPAATPASTVKPMPSPQGTPERSPLPPVTAPPKAPASTRAPAKETSSPSTKAESKSEKKSADEPGKKSEKASTKTETRREKTEPETEPPGKSTKQKKEPKEPSSEPDTEPPSKSSKQKREPKEPSSEPESDSTPKEPKEPKQP